MTKKQYANNSIMYLELHINKKMNEYNLVNLIKLLDVILGIIHINWN